MFLGRQAADHVARWLDAAPADGDAPLFRHIWKNGRVRHCGLASNTVYKIARKRRGSRRNFWTQRTFGAGGHGAVPHRLRRRHRRGCHRGTLEVRGSGHPLRQPPKGGAKRRRQISPITEYRPARGAGNVGVGSPCPPLSRAAMNKNQILSASHKILAKFSHLSGF